MIDIKHKKCVVCQIKQPSFILRQKTSLIVENVIRKYIDIKNKKCIVCNKNPSYFNFKGQKKQLIVENVRIKYG